MPLRVPADLPMRLKAVGLVAFAACAAVAPAQSAEAAWQLIGQIGGPTQAVAAQGNYVYAGVGQRLIVLDVSAPATPLEVGSSAPFADFVRDIAVSGSVAYVAAGGGGLRVLNVSDPTHPAEMGSLQVRGYAEGVAVSGTTVCLADGPYGLRVIDASNPSNPIEIGSTFTRNYAFKAALAGHYAYVAAAGAGLLIADLTNPAKPLEVATLATPGYAYGIAVSGDTVYVAGGWGGLGTVDVTTKAAPRLLAQYQTAGWAMGVTISGTQAYVAAALGGLLVVDVSNPAIPVEVGGLAVTGGDAAGVAVSGTIAYVADRNWGMEALDVSAPTNPLQVGFYGPLGYADGITVAGNYAYLAAGSYGLRIVDISNPAQPRQVGAYDTQSYAKTVAVAGNYAYVGTQQGLQEGLHVVDVSDPTRPTRVGFLPDLYPNQDLALAGGIVYIADEVGLWLVDVSDPTAPKQLSFLQIQTGVRQSTAVGVAVSDNVAYVAVGQGLLVVNVSNPSTPAVIGQLQWPSAFAQHLAVSQGKAFIADNRALTVADVSNPRAPVWLASYPTGGFAESVALAGDQVFVANGGAGLAVIDVSNPGSPALAWSYQTLGYAESVFVRDDLAFVADSSGGLLILERPGAVTASLGRTATSQHAAVTRSMGPGVAPPFVRTMVKQIPAAHSAGAQVASSCVVTSTADSGGGTLRDCLTNASSGAAITFDPAVFPTNRPATIALRSELPFLPQGNVTIDASNAGVILDGGLAGPASSGFQIGSDNNSIKGMQVVHFANVGVWIQGNAHNNLIGGSRSRGSGPLGEGNLLSGNGFAGILINGPNDTNTIAGNLIGTDITGTAAMGNGNGIVVSGSPNTRIGGASPEERNVISGNIGNGIDLNATCGGDCANVIIGNYVGVDASGTKALANSAIGIVLEGGTTGSLVQGNVIAANGSNCVAIGDSGTSYNTVIGNLLGTDASGTLALGSSQSAIGVGGGAAFNRIGGTTPADRNVIAQGGVLFGRPQGGPGNLVLGNFIGTDIGGSIALAKSGLGIQLGDGSNRPIIGGTTAGERNVISGNPYGEIIIGNAGYTFIGGNYIGTDASGQIALGNGSGGVLINQGTHIIVQGNLIAHHDPYAGVSVSGYSGNTIRQNLIYDNQGGGIVLSNGANAGVSPPVVASVSATGVAGAACPGCEVEIFSDSDGEGRLFEGSAFAGVSGAFSFDKGIPLTGPNITATATDGNGNTSGFSPSVAAASQPAPCASALSAGGQSFPAAGGSGSVNVAAASGCSWIASSTLSWVTITDGAPGAGNGTVSYLVAANTGGLRSGNLTVAGIPFTVEQASATSTGIALAGSMAQIASAGGWDTSLTLVNLGTAQGEARLSFYANDGTTPQLPFTFPQQPALGAILGSTFDQNLNAGATLVLDTTGPASQPVATGWSQLLTSGNIGAFAIFDYQPTGQQAVVPVETRNASSYLLAFDDSGALATGLAIANLATSPAIVPVVIRDDTGAQIGTGTIGLPAQGHNSFMLTDPTYGFPATADKRGTVEFDTPSGGQISVLGLRANPIPNSSGFAVTTLPVLANVGTAGGTMAHVASGGGWQTIFTLVNAGTASANATLRFFADDGSPLSLPLSFPQTGATLTETLVNQTIAPGATLVIVTQGQSTSASVTGSAQLSTTANVSGFAIFQNSGQEAVVPLEVGSASSYTLAFDNTGGLLTGIALANSSSLSINVPATLRDGTGATLATTTINLPANGHRSFMLTDSTYGFPAAANIRGTVEFDTPSGGQIGALGIRATPAGAYTSIPVMTK